MKTWLRLTAAAVGMMAALVADPAAAANPVGTPGAVMTTTAITSPGVWGYSIECPLTCPIHYYAPGDTILVEFRSQLGGRWYIVTDDVDPAVLATYGTYTTVIPMPLISLGWQDPRRHGRWGLR